eukprot:1274825-Pleurochrysis_carterae.AAC.1
MSFLDLYPFSNEASSKQEALQQVQMQQTQQMQPGVQMQGQKQPETMWMAGQLIGEPSSSGAGM